MGSKRFVMSRREEIGSGPGPVRGPRWHALRTAPVDALAVLCFGRERRRSPEALKNLVASIGWMAVNWCMAPVTGEVSATHVASTRALPCRSIIASGGSEFAPSSARNEAARFLISAVASLPSSEKARLPA